MQRPRTAEELNRLAADLADELMRESDLAGGMYGRRHAERAAVLVDSLLATLLEPVEVPRGLRAP